MFLGSVEVRLSHTLEEGISFSRRNVKRTERWGGETAR